MYIYCFSRNKSEIEYNLHNKAEGVHEHLLRCFMYPNHESFNHWCNEIYSFISRIQKLKGSNKLPSARWIFNNTCKVVNDRTEQKVIHVIEQDYGPQESNYSAHQIAHMIELYFLWLSIQLSTVGVVSKSNVRNVILEILEEAK